MVSLLECIKVPKSITKNEYAVDYQDSIAIDGFLIKKEDKFLVIENDYFMESKKIWIIQDIAQTIRKIFSERIFIVVSKSSDNVEIIVSNSHNCVDNVHSCTLTSDMLNLEMTIKKISSIIELCKGFYYDKKSVLIFSDIEDIENNEVSILFENLNCEFVDVKTFENILIKTSYTAPQFRKRIPYLTSFVLSAIFFTFALFFSNSLQESDKNLIEESEMKYSKMIEEQNKTIKNLKKESENISKLIKRDNSQEIVIYKG